MPLVLLFYLSYLNYLNCKKYSRKLFAKQNTTLYKNTSLMRIMYNNAIVPTQKYVSRYFVSQKYILDTYMEKVHVAAGGPFCGVRRRPKFLGRFYTILWLRLSPPQILGVLMQFCPGLGSRKRVFLAPWSRSRLKKKNRSRSRLEKKSGAGAAKKLAGSSVQREDKKHKEIVL